MKVSLQNCVEPEVTKFAGIPAAMHSSQKLYTHSKQCNDKKKKTIHGYIEHGIFRAKKKTLKLIGIFGVYSEGPL